MSRGGDRTVGRVVVVAVTFLVSFGTACKRDVPQEGPSLPAPPDPPPVASAAKEAGAWLLAPRCGDPAPPIAIDGLDGARLVATGNAERVADEVVVGVLRDAKPGASSSPGAPAVGGLLRVRASTTPGAPRTRASFVAVGDADTDAPAPLVRVHGDDLFSFFHAAGPVIDGTRDAGAKARPGTPSKSVRPLRIQKWRASGLDAPPTTVATLGTSRDASFAFDVDLADDGGMIVWDDDVPSGSRGEIRGVALDTQGAVRGAPFVVSPATSDAEAPKVSVTRDGAWVAWIARTNAVPRDAGGGGADPAHLEGPGELPTFTWIELARLDREGHVVREAKAVTRRRGHVGEFTFAPDDEGRLALFVHDDVQRADGAGGRLIRVVVSPDGDVSASAAQVAVRDGIGIGDVDVLRPWVRSGSRTDLGPWARSWLLVSDPSDALRITLASHTNSADSVSREPSLTGARPLALDIGGPEAPCTGVPPACKVTFLGAFATSRGIDVREASCRVP
ncbi:MAG: hypothetical protein U0169_25130 [Polyangiaceae bacterium]